MDSESGETFGVFNPTTERLLGNVPKGSRGDAGAAIDAARAAFDSGVWSGKTPADRSQLLWKLADLVEREHGPSRGGGVQECRQDNKVQQGL